MNRRGFLKGLGLAIAAAAVAPAIKLLAEEDTICCRGGYRYGQTLLYNDRPTIEDFEQLIKNLEDQYEEQEIQAWRNYINRTYACSSTGRASNF